MSSLEDVLAFQAVVSQQEAIQHHKKRATATSATARINVNILFKGDKLC